MRKIIFNSFLAAHGNAEYRLAAFAAFLMLQAHSLLYTFFIHVLSCQYPALIFNPGHAEQIHQWSHKNLKLLILLSITG